jgi:hypothetical protein
LAENLQVVGVLHDAENIADRVGGDAVVNKGPRSVTGSCSVVLVPHATEGL